MTCTVTVHRYLNVSYTTGCTHPSGRTAQGTAWLPRSSKIWPAYRDTADRRSEWWRRTAWAFERSLAENDAEAGLGWKLLETIVESKLATKSDTNVVQVIAEHMALDEYDDEEGRHRGARGDPKTSA
jgi:hypothetical protein